MRVLNRNHRYWPLQSISYSCELQAFYYYCCGYTSIVCLMAISVNRLVGICMPTYYDRGDLILSKTWPWPCVFNSVFSKKKVKCGLIVTWLFAPSLLLPFFFNKGFKWVGTRWHFLYFWTIPKSVKFTTPPLRSTFAVCVWRVTVFARLA